jgi:hypothetical protein
LTSYLKAAIIKGWNGKEKYHQSKKILDALV